EDFKRNSYTAYLMCFGSSGMFEQDDVENWVSITDMAAGTMARRLNLNSRMGLASDGQPGQPPPPPLRHPRPGLPGLRRVRPAALAGPVERSPRARAGHPLRSGSRGGPVTAG